MARKRPIEADPETLFRQLLAESSVFREALAARDGAALNAYLQSFPLGTLAGKREAVTAVNARLRALGLAIRCPKTAQPARLVAHLGDHPDVGRFQIELLGPDRRRTVSSPEPPVLDLVPEPADEEG